MQGRRVRLQPEDSREKGDAMRIVLSGGGTAGHINPALALAEELRRRGDAVFFAGTPTGVESRLVPEAGIDFTAFEAAGFNRNHPLSIFRALRLMAKGTRAAKRWFAEVKPDAVVGFGGYVSLAIGRAAEQMGIPLVIHEQNSVMGLANKDLARHADAVCLTYGHAAASVADKGKVTITGNPVRAAVFEATREEGRRRFGVPEDAVMLLVTGGSLGARHLNQALCAMKDELLARDNLYIVHVTGPKELDAVAEALALTPQESQRWQLLGYTDAMGHAMAACDAIVSRAGASSLAEISARAIPALLVPFPFATEDHQTTNAQAAVEAGCAFMVADDQVEGDEFRTLVGRLLDEPDLRAAMRAAAEAQETGNAAALLADIVEAAAKGAAGR